MPESATGSEITFTTRLTKEDWDGIKGAWRCTALAIPKAEVTDLFVEGNRVDKADYEVRKAPREVHWKVGNPPARVAAQIRLSEELSLESETGLWKKLAVVLPFIAALIAAAATYFSKTVVDGPKVEMVYAHLNEWSVDRGRKTISFGLRVEPIDLAQFVSKSDTDKYKLIVGIRPRTSISDVDGKYDYALVYPFDKMYTKPLELNDNLKETVATGCIELVLFRVSAAGLTRLPFERPFVPTHYGPEIKVLQSEYDGACP